MGGNSASRHGGTDPVAERVRRSARLVRIARAGAGRPNRIQFRDASIQRCSHRETPFGRSLRSS